MKTSHRPKKSLHLGLNSPDSSRIHTNYQVDSKGCNFIMKTSSGTSPLKIPTQRQIMRTEDALGPISVKQMMAQASRCGTRTLRQPNRSSIDAERKDLFQLRSWIDTMQEQLSSQVHTNAQEFYDKLELIYSGSIQQIGAHLALKCSDYGVLLNLVWKQFTKQVKEVVDKQHIANQQLEKSGLSEALKVHELYQQTLGDKMVKLNEAEIQWKHNQEWAEKLDKENKYLRRRVRRVDQELGAMRSDFELLKLQYNDQQKENNTLKLFQNQQQRKHHVRQELTYEQLEAEFDEDLYRAKREIFDDFRKVFEDQTKRMEDAYDKRIREVQSQDDKQEVEGMTVEYQEILFKDQCVGNTMRMTSRMVDTSDLIVLQDQTVQTMQLKKRHNECATQTAANIMVNQSCEADYAIIKRDCLPRNQNEVILKDMASYPLQVFINDFHELQINKKDILGRQFQEILMDQIQKLKDRSHQIFGIMKMKDELFQEDFEAVDTYVQSSYAMSIGLANTFHESIAELKEQLIVRKISIYELTIDCKQSNKQKLFYNRQFDQLAATHQQMLKQFNFLIKSLQNISKFVPQYQLDQLRRKAARRKLPLDLKSNAQPIERSVLASQQSLMPLATSPSPFQMKKSLNLLVPTEQVDVNQSRMSFNDMPQTQTVDSVPDGTTSQQLNKQITILFPDFPQDDTTSSEEADADLDASLNPTKQLLSIGQKLFVHRCPSKNALIATQTMMQEITQFRRDKTENLMKLATLEKQLVQFVQWSLKYNKFTYPMHIQLYEFFSIEQFQQPQSVWIQKLARVVKSLIYFKKKSAKSKFFYNIMAGDLNYALYLRTLQGIQNKEFGESSIQVMQAQMVDSLNDISNSNMLRFNGMVDYDLEMQIHLPQLIQTKHNKLLSKYDIVLSIFADGGARFEIDQFRVILCEFEQNKTEKWIIQLFNHECDMEQNDIKYMSFNRFVLICEEFKILNQINEYIKSNSAKYFNDLPLWKLRETELKLMLIRSNNYQYVERELFTKMHNLNSSEQRVILGRYLERRAKELLLQQYTLECLSPFMHCFDQI